VTLFTRFMTTRLPMTEQVSLQSPDTMFEFDYDEERENQRRLEKEENRRLKKEQKRLAKEQRRAKKMEQEKKEKDRIFWTTQFARIDELEKLCDGPRNRKISFHCKKCGGFKRAAAEKCKMPCVQID
jgi:ATPase subunit of ABC transporter with duplicated ATPase domains